MFLIPMCLIQKKITMYVHMKLISLSAKIDMKLDTTEVISFRK